MQLDIITADKTLYSGEVESVTVPGAKGRFQILNGHAALISNLITGKVVVKEKEGKVEFDLNGGIVEVLNNKVIVLA